jgi:Mg/Co/Ni transporter MgtE
MDSVRDFSIAYLRSHPEGAASVLESLGPADAAAFLKDVPEEPAGRALERMQPLVAATILQAMTRKKAASVVLAIDVHSRSRIVRLFDDDLMKSIMNQMPKGAARDLAKFLRYPEGSVGAWMSSDMAVFKRSVTVGECLAQLRALPDTLRGAVFVIDDEGKLVGLVDLAKLLSAPDESNVETAVRTDVKRLSPFARLVSVVALSAWDSTLFLPVVDSKGGLLGALYFDRLREGLASEHRPTAEQPMGQILVHMAEAFLICAAGLLKAPTAKPVLSRPHGQPEV